jgi:hypothetical protein
MVKIFMLKILNPFACKINNIKDKHSIVINENRILKDMGTPIVDDIPELYNVY